MRFFWNCNVLSFSTTGKSFKKQENVLLNGIWSNLEHNTVFNLLNIKNIHIYLALGQCQRQEGVQSYKVLSTVVTGCDPAKHSTVSLNLSMWNMPLTPMGLCLRIKLTLNALLDHSHSAQYWVNASPTREDNFPLCVSRWNSQIIYKFLSENRVHRIARVNRFRRLGWFTNLDTLMLKQNKQTINNNKTKMLFDFPRFRH